SLRHHAAGHVGRLQEFRTVGLLRGGTALNVLGDTDRSGIGTACVRSACRVILRHRPVAGRLSG
ncbi:MAG: hypothetical protein ACOVT5_11080, partial [Armatimonadaceae bacterium]